MELNNKILINKRITSLSFAVTLMDDYSTMSPVGKIEQHLDILDKSPVVNPSNYFVYLNLPAGVYIILTKSEYYFDDSTAVPLKSIPMKSPIAITLKPMPNYPFPLGETLVRGILRDKVSNPIPGARLSYEIPTRGFDTFTTEKGEFVLYFGVLKWNNIKKETDATTDEIKYFVKSKDDTKKLTIQADYNGSVGSFELDGVEAGRTNFFNNIVI